MSRRHYLYGLLIGLLALQNVIALENPVASQRQGFASFDKKDFFNGGEKSRFAWTNMVSFFPHAIIQHGKVKHLEYANSSHLNAFKISYKGQSQNLTDYIALDQRIDSVVIVHNGKIIFEHFKTHNPSERHIMWSVTKVVIASAVGVLAQQAKLSIDSPIETYIPELKSLAWGKVTLRNALNMSSGMGCSDSEGYTNIESCVYRVDQIFDIMESKGKPEGDALSFLKTIPAQEPMGQRIDYNSANTLMLGFVIERVTGLPLSEALSSLVWQPIGTEADAMLLVNQHGEAYAGGGISARLHDVVRFGMAHVAHDSQAKALFRHLSEERLAQPIAFSKDKIERLTQFFSGLAPQSSEWQWDYVWEDGDVYKDGFSGQGLFISPQNKLVMAWFGTSDEQLNIHALSKFARQFSTSLTLGSTK